jgi:hypothetical protein
LTGAARGPNLVIVIRPQVRPQAVDGVGLVDQLFLDRDALLDGKRRVLRVLAACDGHATCEVVVGRGPNTPALTRIGLHRMVGRGRLRRFDRVTPAQLLPEERAAVARG